MTTAGRRVKGEGAPATMQDVARAAGVSRALVSLVMRDAPQVSEERRRRVLAAAADLSYRPNAMARSLASRRTRTIGVLLNDLHNPFFAEIVDGIEHGAEAEGYRLLLSAGGRRRHREEAALDAMLELRVDGVILLSPLLSATRITQTARLVPVVVVSRALRAPQVDSVSTDDTFGVQLAVRHLVDLGHRRIVHVDGGSDPSGPPRRRGYEQAMRALGLAALVVPGDFSESGGANAAEQILRLAPRPSAVVAANDLAAAGAMGRFQDAGVDVPGAMSVVGYDNTSLAALRQISLTTVNQPRDEMGHLALQAVLERIDGGRTKAATHITTPTLVVRRSTGPVLAV